MATTAPGSAAPGAGGPSRGPKSRGRGKPPYPEESRRNGHEGTVDIAVMVGTDGAPLEVKIENTSGFPPLDQAAVEYARKLSFEPALKDGKHVRAWVRFPVRFEL